MQKVNAAGFAFRRVKSLMLDKKIEACGFVQRLRGAGEVLFRAKKNAKLYVLRKIKDFLTF